MEYSSPFFVLGIIAISTFGWVVTSWIRARHGYPLEGEWGGTVARLDEDQQRKTELLETENTALKAAQLRLEERVAVLERIATDPGRRIATEIDSLR